MQNIAIKEQIVKNVVKSGNGGAVWVPKKWLGQEVVVILPDKPKVDIKEKIIHLLEPYLKDAVAVFMYGSYARHEETEESDVDVMVVTKDKAIQLGIEESNLEITAFQLDKLKKAIEKHPVVYYQIVQEAEPLVNSYVLDELKGIKVSSENFKSYIAETEEHIESNKELIELDKLDSKYVKSYSVLYSAMLRLRGIFIIKCILNKDKFSNKEFREWLGKWISNREFEQCYFAYKAIKMNKSINLKIEISVAEKLLGILQKETVSMIAELYG
jgi:predicted nucleotidyltransferase/putative transposon-encoded protein